MRYKIDEWIAIGDDGKDLFIANILVRGLLFWHIVTTVKDVDHDYVINRAKEIISILENPNT